MFAPQNVCLPSPIKIFLPQHGMLFSCSSGTDFGCYILTVYEHEQKGHKNTGAGTGNSRIGEKNSQMFV